MYEVVASTERFRGPIFRVVTDQVTMPDGSVVSRDVVHKFGAVGVVALDDQDRVVLIKQYRHAVRLYLWELPAGLIDVEGEDLADTARRELAEETDLAAGKIERLLDLHLSPGFTSEMIRLFLARDLTEVPDDHRHARVGEEADIEVRRVPLREAVDMVLNGEITNAASVAGILAVSARLAAPGLEEAAGSSRGEAGRPRFTAAPGLEEAAGSSRGEAGRPPDSRRDPP